jgi:hypothetical protein
MRCATPHCIAWPPHTGLLQTELYHATMAQPCRRLANVSVMSHRHYLPLDPQPSSVVPSRSSSMHASFSVVPLVRTPRRPDDPALPPEDGVSGRTRLPATAFDEPTLSTVFGFES